MGNPLRDQRTAAELASVGQVIEIAEKISSFDGLSAILEADLAALESDKLPAGWHDSVVLGELHFGFADARESVPAVSGSAAVTVDAVCQRCLEPFKLGLTIEPKLVLLDENQASDDYDDFEVWELDDEAFRPLDIVEELLIMAMPFSATHDNMADCKAFSFDDDDEEPKMIRPFAALGSQMKQD